MNAPLPSAALVAAHDLLDKAALQALIVQALHQVLPAHALLYQTEDTTAYECDGLTAYRQRPLVVALPEDEAQVQAVLQTCHALRVPIVARGAGTGLSGGAMPHARGVTLSLAKFNTKSQAMGSISRSALLTTTHFTPLIKVGTHQGE